MELHVHSHGRFVAIISKQHKLSDGFTRETPWLLLSNTGRVDRFATMAEARDEARKTWPSVGFKRI